MAKGHTGGPRPNSNRQGRTRTLTAQKSPREKTRGSGEERTAGLTACCGDGANSRARARAARSLVCGKKGDHQRPLKPKFDEGTAAKQPSARDIPGQTPAWSACAAAAALASPSTGNTCPAENDWGGAG
jgi:hypothetical protein